MEDNLSMQTQTTLKGEPKKLDVTVHIKDDPTKLPPEPPYDFSLEYDDGKGGKKKGNDIFFHNEIDGKKYDGFDVTFEIDDHTGKGFKFMDDATTASGDPDPDCAPMWVKTVNNFGESCPSRQFWDQFKTVKVSGSNSKLHVRNENDYKQEFKFALLFSRNPQQGPCEIMYDPDGTNGNGQKPLK